MDQKLANNTLHVLNGDSTKALFPIDLIPGDLLVWREALCEGKVNENISTDMFWKDRAAHIEEAYQSKNYEEKVLSEISRLKDLSQFEEVTLWFEYDLFCQVNLIACLSYMDTRQKISLVCLGDELDGQLRGLGEVDSKHYPSLFASRIQLAQDDIDYAKAVWKVYSDETTTSLKHFYGTHKTLKYLGKALASHEEKIPAQNGLNAIETKMLEVVNSTNNENELIGSILKDQTWLGMGDSQYWNYFAHLRPLIDDSFALNEAGIEILAGRQTFQQPNHYIGGLFRPTYFQETYGDT